MSGKHIVDIAYSAAKDKYEDKSFTFNELFSLIKQNEKSDSRKLTLGEIYTELLLDPRFAYVSNGNWKLREYLSEKELKNISNSMYDISNDEVNNKPSEIYVQKSEADFDADFKEDASVNEELED